METPVFEEFDPVSDCDCPGCRYRCGALPHPPGGRAPARPAAHRVLAVATAATATAALGAGQAAAAPAVHALHGVLAGEESGTPQGPRAPLHGPTGRPASPAAGTQLPALTRTDIIERAEKWVTAKVPYSTSSFWSDGYRQDCSGYVSMAWKLPANEWTGSLGAFADRITKEELQPGDILLFHNASDPQTGSHVVIFGGWTDGTRTSYTAYEQTPPHTRKRSTPYAYWSNSAKYLPYRYKGVTDDTTSATDGTTPATGGTTSATGGTTSATGGAPATTAYPRTSAFGPGADTPYVTGLGRMLAVRGAGRFHAFGPGPRRPDADRRATEAFQQAQERRGANADGLPGPAGAADPAAPPASHGVPGYPGRAMFRPGADNPYVTRLGGQLVRKGFGRHYTSGPGPRWGEADRRNVEAFQRAQGWRGGAADGYPGPETWRRLFS